MRWVLLAALLQMAATCGQKGPLILPEEETGRVTAIRLGEAIGGLFLNGAAAHAGHGPSAAKASGAELAPGWHSPRAGLRHLAAA